MFRSRFRAVDVREFSHSQVGRRRTTPPGRSCRPRRGTGGIVRWLWVARADVSPVATNNPSAYPVVRFLDTGQGMPADLGRDEFPAAVAGWCGERIAPATVATFMSNDMSASRSSDGVEGWSPDRPNQPDTWPHYHSSRDHLQKR